MATEMSTGWLTRAIEQARAAEQSGGLYARLHTAGRPAPAVLPPMPAFKPWGRVVRPGVPGKLSAYPSRVEHARAHRLAAERARRNRRSVRKGRTASPRKTGTVNWTMTIDTSGFQAAIEGIGAAFRRFGEQMSVVHARLVEFDVAPLMRLYEAATVAPPAADETTGRDTGDCAASGGRWSDLMACIDDLTEEA